MNDTLLISERDQEVTGSSGDKKGPKKKISQFMVKYSDRKKRTTKTSNMSCPSQDQAAG